MGQEIRVFAPATVANVGCGFDIFGFAVDNPGDEVIVKKVPKKGVFLTSISGDNGVLPKDPLQNTATVGVLKYLESLQYDEGFEIELHKKMPLGSGLGSSAASAAATLYAINTLLGSPLSSMLLIPFAMEAERAACGTAHADNVAPALLGGFTLIRSYSPLEIVKIPLQTGLYCTVLHPHIEIRTEDARKVLKKEVALEAHVRQSGNAAGLIAGLIQGDLALVGRCIQDHIIEPLRAPLIPGFFRIKEAALVAGALGCSISGSGPSIFALSQDSMQAQRIAENMHKACSLQGVASTYYVSAINQQGPRVC